MEIQLMSDLHLEFGHVYGFGPQRQFSFGAVDFLKDDERNEETILVLAGDICPLNRVDWLKEFLNAACDKYHSVVYVAGNHEFYKSSLSEGYLVLESLDDLRRNLHVLTSGKPGVVIGEHIFFGDVMWTDVPAQYHHYGSRIADYHHIYNSEGKDRRVITPAFTSFLHTKQLMEIEQQVTNLDWKKDKLKKVLVSHHAPSNVAAHPKYIGGVLEPYFQNVNLTPLQAAFYSKFDLVLHGHTHWSYNAVDGATGALCVANCLGYPNESCGFSLNVRL